MSGNETLIVKKQRAVKVLVKGGNVANAARIANVSHKTLYRWLKAHH